ncbi:MAG: SPOR domain-containing protein, partial [Sulfurovaceae bacterium]|nr:SPOR domain-containing protein [Sulfurovaceae bacterium]
SSHTNTYSNNNPYSTISSSTNSYSSNNPYSTTSSSTNSYSSNNPYSTTSSHTNSYSNNNPYSTTSSSTNSYSSNNPYSTTSSNTHSNTHSYHTNTNYNISNRYSSSGSGIQLQVAALSSYYAAKEFKNNLSIDPKYSAYIKKGKMNKVIIKGFSSRAEAKALATRQFPGAFIVSGSSSSSSSYSSTPSYSRSSSHSSNNSHSSSSTNSASGIGIQVGAFSSKNKARSVAKSKAGGKYTAIVKTAKVHGRTIYKAIILGFSSRAAAKKAIASGRFGSAFVVNIH